MEHRAGKDGTKRLDGVEQRGPEGLSPFPVVYTPNLFIVEDTDTESGTDKVRRDNVVVAEILAAPSRVRRRSGVENAMQLREDQRIYDARRRKREYVGQSQEWKASKRKSLDLGAFAGALSAMRGPWSDTRRIASSLT